MLFILQVNHVFSQDKTITVSFKPVFGKSSFVLNDSTYQLTNGHSISFEELKFYTSGFQLFQNDSLVYAEQNSFHLYDASAVTRQNILLDIPADLSFNKLCFNVGIDSITSVSGAMGGDLDPTKGMYWVWQSGYINIKLEGRSDLCKNPGKEFRFHLGGYMHPFNALTTVVLQPLLTHHIQLKLDVKAFIDAMGFSEKDHVMSPDAYAVKLSVLFSKCFEISQ